MPSHRMDRINEEVRRELSSIFMELKDPRIAKIISITGVNTTPDLRYCKVWVSVMEDNKRDGTLKGLNSSRAFIRREIGRRLNLRLTPEFTFEMDDSISRGAKISKIIHSLDISRDDEKEDEEES
jgi:ribosome-binding factor A